jgi:hypothetical protein
MKIHGNDVDQKFNSVEKALNRLGRKIKPESTCFVPPIPVSFYKDGFEHDLVVGRYIFPASGMLMKAVVYLTFSDKKQPTQIVVRSELNDSRSEHSFNMQNRQAIEKLNIRVPVGTRLSFSLEKLPDGLVSVWLGFLYQIDVKHSDVHKIALEQLGAIDEGTDTDD